MKRTNDFPSKNSEKESNSDGNLAAILAFAALIALFFFAVTKL